MTTTEQYEAIKKTAAIGAISARNAIGVTGGDRAVYLQGLLTNDIQVLTAGSGCYAAWLTPQGRMLTDIHLFESGDMILLDVPAAELPAMMQRLDQFRFSEDVQFADLSKELEAVWVHGPAVPAMLEQVLSGATGLASWPEYHNSRAAFEGAPLVVARVSQLGVPGFCAYVEPARSADLRRGLVAAGAVEAGQTALEVARIEAGYPVFGIDMTYETIPLEAGIEDRAISLTKGCYVGQEVIIRVLHRGHGKVAKRLVALVVEGGVPEAGARIFAGDKHIGVVTSAAHSSRFGMIALGYVHRDFVAPGTGVAVDTPLGRASAVVSDRPLR
jgi:folate-binding protein YgfZ